jgi:integrase
VPGYLQTRKSGDLAHRHKILLAEQSTNVQEPVHAIVNRYVVQREVGATPLRNVCPARLNALYAHALWRLAATTGARRGELLAITWRALDLDGAQRPDREGRVAARGSGPAPGRLPRR